MEGIKQTKLAVIKNPLGDILHSLKCTEPEFSIFGEHYFSKINFNQIKGWKRHSRMISNLTVPVGLVRFVVCNETDFAEYILGEGHHYRLTVNPGLWMAFQGLSENINLVSNIASIAHDPSEASNHLIDHFKFDWNKPAKS
jgi:dTDP-4-dehydrorhamnose 3,5-epimerase